ncbi:unnamed protein product [Bemisia tabaci]|uniref:Sugar phosphate transporter domain-containing protein n=1 Tax=Bemisia tabaci TaxID=7038 RepID=A0A9P0F0E9_BEMTA|nr:unnamed protein product [Bemisia tabaci]
MARMVMDSSTSSEPLTPGSVLSKSHSLLTTISVIASYFVLSISLIYYQKWLIARCKFPLSIVTVHIILKFFLSAIFRKLWEMITSRKRKSLSWQNSILKIAPVGVTSGLDIGFSNWSLEFIAVSLYAMTKSTSVIFILFFALLLHLEEKSWSIVLIVMMISGGLAMFTYHSAEFHFIGFILALLGSISSGVRWTLSQFLMQRSEMGLKNPLDMMYHVQPWIFVSIIPLMLLFEGTDISEIQRSTKTITQTIKTALKKKKLLTEDSKTEALLLHGPKKAKDVEISVGESIINAGSSLISLGFTLTGKLRMTQHIKDVCSKAKKITSHYRPLLPNLNGPAFIQKRIMIHAMLSVIFYGVAFWGPACKSKGNINEIRKTIRPMKLALCSSYRTVSDACLDIISGIPSTKILIKEKIEKYNRKDPYEIEQDKKIRWQIEWEETKGNLWIKKLIPQIHIWLNRKHGNTNYYLTQFLTNHGAYAQYLFRFKKRSDPFCPMCKNLTIDDAEHTFFHCESFKLLRNSLQSKLNVSITPENIIEQMINTKKNWYLIQYYITEVLKQKQKVLNEDGNEMSPEMPTYQHSSLDDMSADNSEDNADT